jgi:hypothetical protein
VINIQSQVGDKAKGGLKLVIRSGASGTARMTDWYFLKESPTAARTVSPSELII